LSDELREDSVDVVVCAADEVEARRRRRPDVRLELELLEDGLVDLRSSDELRDVEEELGELELLFSVLAVCVVLLRRIEPVEERVVKALVLLAEERL